MLTASSGLGNIKRLNHDPSFLDRFLHLHDRLIRFDLKHHFRFILLLQWGVSNAKCREKFVAGLKPILFDLNTDFWVP